MVFGKQNAALPQKDIRLKSSSNRFLGIDLSSALVRELVDASVILSILFLFYFVLTAWGGLALIGTLIGAELEAPSFFYFCGVALAIFSIRRMADQRSERLKRVAAEFYDPLTQLPNRRQLQIDLAVALKRSNNVVSVLLVGLDQFRKLNEVYGHLGCDEALLQIAARMREFTKPGDILARVGDSEFALCVAWADPEAAHAAARSIIDIVKKPVQIGIEFYGIGASVGITQAGRGHMTVDELLRCAHVALSRARTTNVDCCFFDPRMDAHVRERSLMERDLRAALGGYEIRPYFQPIIDLKTRRIIGFESLARWHHPISGMVAPDTFIPIAEELGLIDPLSGQLFGDACREAATWPDYIMLSFNFSPTQLANRNFAHDVLHILRETGLPPYRLEAEITESALVSDFEATRHVIQTLRNAGVRIAIDDFGTGYSGLSQLYELRFDKLKIDKRFIQELGRSTESEILVRAMLGMARGLDMLVTAEGIETELQAEKALQNGVHQGQGFLFGHAVPPEEVTRLLAGAGAGTGPQRTADPDPQPAQKLTA
jgi:diguanylate cyclase (GGDEF)-like protein